MKNMYTLALIFSIAALTGCPKEGPVPVIGGAAIDCLGQNRSAIESMLSEFLPALTGGHIDWSSVYARGKSAGRDIGTCFVLELTNMYIGGGGAKANGDAKTVYDNAQKFRAENADGATVHTLCVGDDGAKHECNL